MSSESTSQVPTGPTRTQLNEALTQLVDIHATMPTNLDNLHFFTACWALDLETDQSTQSAIPGWRKIIRAHDPHGTLFTRDMVRVNRILNADQIETTALFNVLSEVLAPISPEDESSVREDGMEETITQEGMVRYVKRHHVSVVYARAVIDEHKAKYHPDQWVDTMFGESMPLSTENRNTLNRRGALGVPSRNCHTVKMMTLEVEMLKIAKETGQDPNDFEFPRDSSSFRTADLDDKTAILRVIENNKILAALQTSIQELIGEDIDSFDAGTGSNWAVHWGLTKLEI